MPCAQPTDTPPFRIRPEPSEKKSSCIKNETAMRCVTTRMPCGWKAPMIRPDSSATMRDIELARARTARMHGDAGIGLGKQERAWSRTTPGHTPPAHRKRRRNSSWCAQFKSSCREVSETSNLPKQDPLCHKPRKKGSKRRGSAPVFPATQCRCAHHDDRTPSICRRYSANHATS